MIHATHPDIVNRLKRADGHLRTIIEMIEAKRECLDVAHQLHAVEKALGIAKRVYIQDHIDNCIEEAVGAIPRDARESLSEFREITKFL
ncbi:MAG: metal-sensing transcriptional repressor [Candidatus Binataceae bacterium]